MKILYTQCTIYRNTTTELHFLLFLFCLFFVYQALSSVFAKTDPENTQNNIIQYDQNYCTYQTGIDFKNNQIFQIKNRKNESKKINSVFTKEYLVINISEHTCPICVQFAESHNQNQEFIARTSGNSSCDFITIVENGTLVSRLQKIGGPSSYIGSKSRSFDGDREGFIGIPTLYGGDTVTHVPLFVILNRNAQIVAQKVGDLPQAFRNTCIQNSCYGIRKGEIGIDEGGSGNACSGGGQQNNQNQSNQNETGGETNQCSGGACTQGNSGGNTNGSQGNEGNNGGSDGEGSEGEGNWGENNGNNSGEDGGGSNGNNNESGQQAGNNSENSSTNPGEGGQINNITPYQGQSNNQGNVGRLRIALPYENQMDIFIKDDYLDSQNSKDRIIYTIKIVNERLRIILLVTLMGAIIRAGYLLITSRGQEEKLKQANHILFYSAIGFGIALFAYAIISLVVNIFA